MGFVDVMKSFVLSPGEETLAPLQAEIMAAANYDPLVRLESVVSPLVDSGDHQGVVDAVWRMLPGVFLSPTAHAMLAHSYDRLGDEKAARRETWWAALSSSAPLPVATTASPVVSLAVSAAFWVASEAASAGVLALSVASVALLLIRFSLAKYKFPSHYYGCK